MGTIYCSGGQVFAAAWCFCTLWASVLFIQRVPHVLHHSFEESLAYLPWRQCSPCPFACVCVLLLRCWWSCHMMPARLAWRMCWFLSGDHTLLLQWCLPTGRIRLLHFCSMGSWCFPLHTPALTLLPSVCWDLSWLANHVSLWMGGFVHSCMPLLPLVSLWTALCCFVYSFVTLPSYQF